MSEVENPLEPFKRAMTATMRAIAEDDELEVTFVGTLDQRADGLTRPLSATLMAKAWKCGKRGFRKKRLRHISDQCFILNRSR